MKSSAQARLVINELDWTLLDVASVPGDVLVVLVDVHSHRAVWSQGLKIWI